MIKNFFHSKLFILFGLCLFTLLGLGVGRNYLRKQQINKEIAALQGEISELEQGNQELSSLIGYLQTSNFIEQQAKTKLGLVREGESVVVVTPPDKMGDTGGSGEEGPRAAGDLPNYERWWYYFWQ